MKLLYLHGFGSKYDKFSDKIKSLSKISEVIGIDLDYSQSYDQVLSSVLSYIGDGSGIDGVIGTSLGGWLSSQVSYHIDKPCISINPSLTPSISMLRYVGEGVTYYGSSYNLSVDVCGTYDADYQTMVRECLVLLDASDEVLDSAVSYAKFKEYPHIKCHMFDGGSHRFEHMEESLSIIEDFINHRL